MAKNGTFYKRCTINYNGVYIVEYFYPAQRQNGYKLQTYICKYEKKIRVETQTLAREKEQRNLLPNNPGLN